MSTRALYTFIDSDDAWNVYKHCDGSPHSVAQFLQRTVEWFAWKLPRFEADAFAAAFIAAGKSWDHIDALTAKPKRRAEFLKDWGPDGPSRACSGGSYSRMTHCEA